MNNHEPTHLDLFSGIGGFAIAAQWAGFRTIAFSEVDPYCIAVLRKHWPYAPNLGDIWRFNDWPELGNVHVVTGGPPCQPFSIAGRKWGTADNRNCWPAMLGVIKRYRPDFVVVENVVNSADMVLSFWQDDLEAIGYSSQAFDIPSCAVGLPSVERHMWLVAACDGERSLPDSKTGVQGIKLEQVGEEWEQGIRGKIEDASSQQCRGWMPLGTGLRRSVKGFPNFVDRIRTIGNSVPPSVAMIILEAIKCESVS